MATDDNLILSLADTCSGYMRPYSVQYYHNTPSNDIPEGWQLSEPTPKLERFFKEEVWFSGYRSLKQKCILLILQDRNMK